MRRVLSLLPEALTRRLARHAVPVALLAIAAVLFSGVAIAALVAPGSVGITAARLADTRALPDALRATALTERDADLDGLPDALENYLYGTDPENWDSAGLGIPDGWLVQFGHDPLSPLTSEARGAAPPAHVLPASYADGYPLAYTPTLDVYYAWSKPADYRPGVDAPWWRAGAHADPSAWDQSGTGIPTGWLLHRGLDPTRVDPDRVAPGSKGNLTIRQAFEHDTDPLREDSDGDGLTDWAEIHVHRTSPARFSTSGAGIADGWLVRFGLNAFDKAAGTQDPDFDGLTNLEEFTFSYDALRQDVLRDGISILFTRGLDPNEWQTSRSGIPDGWYVKFGLSPFGGDAERVLGRASDWPEIRNLDSAPEGFEPLADLAMTVRDAYAYGRPSDWNESQHGVWWGGTNPVTLDTDEDGIPDPIEIRGWYANVTPDVGPEAKTRVYVTASNPLEPDSDGDGLTDLEEHRGRAECGPGDARVFPPTDPRNRDTAFSGLTDAEKVCGVVRGNERYDFKQSAPGARILDPTRADSAGDYATDGARLAHWHAAYEAYLANPRYPYPGSAYKTLYEWTEKHARFAGLTREDTLEQFRPDGDVDGDGIPNALDADPSGGLFRDRADPSAARTKVYFLGGPQMDPSLYRFTELASSIPHSATDPANPDTDGDELPDAWETRFGVFDATIGGWNLDPAKYCSACRGDTDGASDKDANNDGDVITWYAYDRRGSDVTRTTNTFDFTNWLEYRAGTNPNDVSTAGDGVPDGWKAFWGSRTVSDDTYPNLLGARDARVGGIALERATEIEAALADGAITPLADLAGLGAKKTGYARFVNVTACVPGSPELLALLRPSEAFPASPCYSGQDLEGDNVNIARIEGVSTLTYRREAELRTNPYLVDSDADGAPDAYEAYYLKRTPGGGAYPDPATHDADKDPDGDGVGVADECASLDGGRTCGARTFDLADARHGAGADPNVADTDFDGIQDGIELGALLDPLDPSDVEGFRDPNRDTDGDAIPDFQELTGWGKPEFGVSVRTSQEDFDTDGDGLLDGPTLNVDPRTAAGAARKAAFDARGIAHRARDDGTVDYYGERTFGAAFGFRPDKRVSTDKQTAPDGWLAYYGENPIERAPLDGGYAKNRPTWWNEERHGVWWWGVAPGETAAPDRDHDGLRDAIEDPFPATSRLNRIVDGALVLTDPAQVRLWVESGATPADVRARAQRVGDGAGDPAAAWNAARVAVDANDVLTRNDRARVALLDVALQNGTTLTKGVAFAATGRVVLDERTPAGALLEGSEAARIGLANRTVLLSFFRPTLETAVGAAVTDANGSFRIETRLTGDFELTLAHGVPLDLHGGEARVDGRSIDLPIDPEVVRTGLTTAGERNRLVVWVLNTSATPPADDPARIARKAWLADKDNQHAERTTHGTGFAVAPAIEVSVRSETRLQTTVSPTAENGGFLVGDAKLVDTSGAILPDRPVHLRWDGGGSLLELRNLTTNRDGVVNLTRLGLAARVATPDQRALTLTFPSSDPYLSGTTATFPITIRDPTALSVGLSRGALTVGEALDVEGVLETRSITLATGAQTGAKAVPGATVRVVLGAAEETVTTDDRGAYRARLIVPGTLVAGSNPLTVSFSGDERLSGTLAETKVDVKRTASIVGLNRIEGPRSIDVTLRGRLVDNEGAGFFGAITVEARGFPVATGKARDDGTFSLTLPLSRLDLGNQQLRVVFPGDATHAAAENFTQARVTSTTTLELLDAPRTIVRGDEMPIRAVLRDDQGAPVAGQAVALSWRGERVAVLVTDAQGVLRASVPTNVTERPSTTSLAAEYLPQPTAVYRASTAAVTVDVLQGSDLQVTPGGVHRGPISIGGRLLDDEGRPIAAARITVDLAGARLGEARTTRNGSFEVGGHLAPDRELGAVPVVIRYDGTRVLAGAELQQTWFVRSAVTAQWSTLGPFVRGERAPVEGRVLDDQGKGVDGDIVALLDGRNVGTLLARGGIVKGGLVLPADLERGVATLVLTMAETPRYDAFERPYPVVIQLRPKVDVQLPALAIRGFAFGGEVTLRDDRGAPLPNTTFLYAVGADGSPVVGQTDADGRATLASVAPLGGEAYLALTVRGGTDVVAAQYQTPKLTVVGPATPFGYATLVLGALAVLAIIGLVVAVAILRRRQLEEVREILDDAIRELLAGNEYAGTIFLAYRRLAAHVARHGYAEKAHETPREFASGVRKAVPVGAVPLRELIRLFEEARYSDHPIGSRERDRAVEHLGVVRGELDRVLGRPGGAHA